MGFRYRSGLLGSSMRAALILLWILSASAEYIPLLFPSPVDTLGNVYNNVTGKLLPVESSFVESVCATNNETIRLGEAETVLPPCGTFVLYTESSEASFTVMDLFDDGRVIRKIREPEFNVTVLETGDTGGVVVTPRFVVVQKQSGETVEFADATNYQLTNLPLNKIVRFEVSEFNQATRHIFISRSSPKALKPPTAKITRVNAGDRPNFEGLQEFHVTFSDWVVLNQALVEKHPCTNELEHRFVQRVTDGAIAINQTLLDVDCPQANLADFSEATLMQMVEVLGASNVSMSYKAPPYNLFERGSPMIIIKAYTRFDNELPQANSTMPLSVVVPKGRVMSFGGVVNKRSFAFSDSLYSKKDIQKATDYATSMTVMAGAGVTTAVTTSVGVAVASASTGTVAGSAAGGSMAGASSILNEAQKIFLIGQVALAGIPETCEALSDGLEWTMLNIRLPWEKDGDEETDSRIAVKRGLFWSAVLLVGLFLLHSLLLIFLLRVRISIPTILRLPRLELYFGYWAIPAIATASAGLFKDDGSKSDDQHRDDIILGVALLLLFPGLFIILHIYTLWTFFYRRLPQSYKAIAVFENEGTDFELEALRSRLGSAISDIETNLIDHQIASPDVRNPNIQDATTAQPAETKIVTGQPVEDADPEESSGCCGCCGAFLEKFLWTPLLGPPYSGEWIAPSGPRNLFYARFGAMFEEFRGKPMGIRGNTYGVDENTHSVDRGIPTPVKVTRSVYSSSWEGSSIGHHLQVSGKVFDMFKLVFIATLISGEDDPETVAQVIVILTLSVIFFISLRIFRTPISRWDLGMTMFGELTDIITFTIALIIFTADLGEDAERTIGWIMMVTKTLTFMATMLDQFFLVVELVQGVIAAIKQKLGMNPKLLEVVISLQIHNPQYLERKFFNRWVRNSIGKGIQAAPVKAGVAPFEEVVYFKLFGGRQRDDARRPETKETKERREKILARAKEESRVIIRMATERARRQASLAAPPSNVSLPLVEINEEPAAIGSPSSTPPAPPAETDERPTSPEISEKTEGFATEAPPTLDVEPQSPPKPEVVGSTETAAVTEGGTSAIAETPPCPPPEESSPFFYPADEELPTSTTPEPVATSAPAPETERRRRPRPEPPVLAGVGSGNAWQVAPDERPDKEKESQGSSIGRFFRRVVSYTSR